MNVVLLFPNDFIGENAVRLNDRRFVHIRNILRATCDTTVKVGMINGSMGVGTISTIDDQQVTLRLTLESSLQQDPPPPLPLNLVVALPRPQMLKRIIQISTSLGVKNFYFIGSERVEKSFWQSPQLQEKSLMEHRVLGLEQARDTMLPTVHFEKKIFSFLSPTIT